MKKLEQLLYKHSDSYQKSASTNTIYFKFGEITVRYSDHAAFKDSQSVQFNIVKPENDCNYYTVFANTGKCYIMNARQVLGFIQNSIQYLKLTLYSVKYSEGSPKNLPEDELIPKPIDKSKLLTFMIQNQIKLDPQQIGPVAVDAINKRNMTYKQLRIAFGYKAQLYSWEKSLELALQNK